MFVFLRPTMCTLLIGPRFTSKTHDLYPGGCMGWDWVRRGWLGMGLGEGKRHYRTGHRGNCDICE